MHRKVIGLVDGVDFSHVFKMCERYIIFYLYEKRVSHNISIVKPFS